ncbi:TPA: entry exclusion lipoprotein TrbK [Pseudomonas aeruginosa]|nr:entry exclusion lipoprotein TrbK [Pseudomonas aeruginosa]HEQ1694947.1 entry exclusion lipoprotein TrbK [Pseudomonas aeruginosa]HEQ1730685.1 entry exclusion lipoprotein TrbK [Pseudomonas aeruginosa]HEQ1737178.1 entry exclusion lipoprotein TrbK [Pseudomonas aeruginosa]HEQ1789923.1 entry exclusion lipoprotein TrbK [Pseudomonas aeruginosa]
MIKILFTAAVAVLLLAGCEQERMPEPNAATCAPDAFQAALNEMRSEANRAAFTEECRAFQKAKQMRQWEFKPSPKDNY